jgi:calcineurin-like phosphoesterase
MKVLVYKLSSRTAVPLHLMDVHREVSVHVVDVNGSNSAEQQGLRSQGMTLQSTHLKVIVMGDLDGQSQEELWHQAAMTPN